MTKRVFAFVLVLALVISLMPAVTLGVTAAEPGASEQSAHTNHDGWTEWTDTTKLPDTAGNYYLSANVNLTTSWVAPDGVHLCLNGKTITQTVSDQRILNVNAGRTVSIYDCAVAYNANGTYVGGKLTGGTRENGTAVWVARGTSLTNPGTFNLYGGRITGNALAGRANSGAVYLQSGQKTKAGAQFNMYGGEIVDNGVNGTSTGGAVQIHGEPEAANRGEKPATFNMYGGLLQGNKAKHGAAVYCAGDAVANIKNAKILDNVASGSGSIWLTATAKLTVENTTIQGNKTANAPAIYAQGSAIMELKNTTITENVGSSIDVQGYGSAIHICGAGNKLTLSGKNYIAGNTVGCENIASIHMRAAGSDTLYVNELAAGSYVEFSTGSNQVTDPDEPADTAIIGVNGTQTQWDAGWLAWMDASGNLKHIGREGTNFGFVEGHFHENVLYTPWTETDKLPSEGNYYLTENVTITNTDNKANVDGGKSLDLCMNGKTISGNDTCGDLIRVAAGSLHLQDCTTVYDKDGRYVSGGKVIDAKRKGNGAALYINNADSEALVEGIAFIGNDSTETTSKFGGGAVQVRKNTQPVKFVGCLFSGNTSKNEGGAIALRESANMVLENCVFTNNEAELDAAAVYVLGSTLTATDCLFEKNAAKVSGGAISVTTENKTGNKNSTVIIDGCEFRQNTAANASAIYIAGTSQVTIKNTTITDNTNTSKSGYGAVNLANGASTVKLQGKVIIKDNLNKDDQQQNLHLQKSNTIVYDVSGLTAGSQVGVSLIADRTDMYFTPAGMTTDSGYCFSDDDTYKVELVDGRLTLVENTGSVTPPPAGHTHKLCNDASCTAHGSDVTFEPWGEKEEEKTTLPTSGNYYLTCDIDMTAAVSTTGDLNLCLNGKTVKQTTSGARILVVMSAHTVSITDCGTTGKITGGTATFGSAVNIRNDGVFKLYGGKITGNSNASEGTVYLQGGKVEGTTNNPVAAKFYMYGGEISNNVTNKGGAISAAATIGAVTELPGIYIYGGKLANNTTSTSHGGAINASGMSVMYIENAQIIGNTSANEGGAIYSATKGDITIKNTVIQENQGKNGSGVSAFGGTLTLENVTIEKNHSTNSFGALHVNFKDNTGTFILKGDTIIQNNTAGADEIPENVFLRATNNGLYLDVSGLTDAARIGLSRQGTRVQDRVSTAALGSEAELTRFTSDSDGYVVDRDAEGYLELTKKVTTTDHMHNVCCDATCTDHATVPYEKWEKTDSLPDSGNWYLAENVTLTEDAEISGNLNLCLNGKTITQTVKGQRVITVKADVTLTISDCGTTGTITGSRNNFGAVYVSNGATFNLYGGTLTGNKPVDNEIGSGTVFLHSANKSGATFNMYGGKLVDNGSSKHWGGAISNGSGNANNTVYVNIYGGEISGNKGAMGGAIRMSRKSVTTIYGGTITGNTANEGGAIYLDNAAELVLAGGEITGNEATGAAGGIFVSGTAKVTVKGAPVVTDNTVNGKQNNLYLNGDAVITLGAVEATAKVGVTAVKIGRAISSETDADCSASFPSDSAFKTITYKDKKLYIDGSSNHNHCVCGGSNITACDHTAEAWQPWESNSTLPTATGYYYLTENVTMAAAQSAEANQEIFLCLNGFTVTAAKNARHLALAAGTTYTITDCNENAGGLTGGNKTYGGSINVVAGSTLNLFGGKLYGNTSPESEGGAVYIQASKVDGALPGGIFNMYGGEISGNTAGIGGAIRGAGTNSEELAACQINIYGGLITGNKAEYKITVDAETQKEQKTHGQGGGIAGINGTIINLLGGQISDNTSEGEGAGIYINAKSQLTIKDGKISGNTTKNYGGGVFATSNGTTITMDGGEISGNKADNGGGLITQTRSAFTMNGGKITGNETKSAGAGFYISTNTSFTMNGGEVSGNKAGTRGGGAYFLRSEVVLNKGTFLNNTADDRAGAFGTTGSNVQIHKITIQGNSAKEGGAIYAGRTSSGSGENITYYPAKITIHEGALITGNKATTNCGAILIANDDVELTMLGGEISKNTAPNGGGVMTWKGSTFILKGGKIVNNTVTACGGGIYISTDSSFKMEGGTIGYNTAKNGGGAYFLRSTAVLSGGSITGNYGKYEVKWVNGQESKSGGQGAGMTLSGANVTLCGTSLTGNTAEGNGGAVITGRASYKVNGVSTTQAPKLTMTGGIVSGNKALNAGGILIQTDTIFKLSGGLITKNTATHSGGGVYASTKSNMTMTGGRIVENHAEKTGGGVYCLRSKVEITGGEINSNSAVTNSANLMVSGGTDANVTIKNIKFFNGQANTGASLVVQTTGSKLTMENCEFFDNASLVSHGGAIFVSTRAIASFTNCKFYNNVSANLGGAVLVNNFANATFTGCEFYNNKSTMQGGAVWCSVGSNTTMTDCHFHDNEALTKGGAIVMKGNGTFQNVLVENNTAVEGGGGIYTDVNTTTGTGIMDGLVMDGCKVVNNTTDGIGGGMYIHKGCRVEIYNSEITGNTSALEGGGIWAYEDLELHNTSITGNTSGGAGYAVYMNDANYDGHSYFTSRNKLSGNVIIKDNEGGNLYMGEDVVFVITADGLGQDTYIDLQLHSGTVTNRIFGSYNYEGGECKYIVTAGNRSMTDPEPYEVPTEPVPEDSQPTEDTQADQTQEGEDNTMLYIGIGAIAAVVVLAAVAVALLKKKKAGKAESK